jgi:hypothetical protein
VVVVAEIGVQLRQRHLEVAAQEAVVAEVAGMLHLTEQQANHLAVLLTELDTDSPAVGYLDIKIPDQSAAVVVVALAVKDKTAAIKVREQATAAKVVQVQSQVLVTSGQVVAVAEHGMVQEAVTEVVVVVAELLELQADRAGQVH